MAENANFERIISIFKPHFYDDTIFRKIQFFVIFDLHLDIENGQHLESLFLCGQKTQKTDLGICNKWVTSNCWKKKKIRTSLIKCLYGHDKMFLCEHNNVQKRSHAICNMSFITFAYWKKRL